MKLGDTLNFGFETAINLAAMVALFALAGWMWPDGLLRTPVAFVTLGKILWAFGSVVVGLFALGGCYFILVEPLIRRRQGLR